MWGQGIPYHCTKQNLIGFAHREFKERTEFNGWGGERARLFTS